MKVSRNLPIFFLMAFLMASAALAENAPIPRPEHPMPQMERAEWLNLNGVWDFAETDNSKDLSFLEKESYPDKITVPFCRESKLSGLERRGFVTNVWYRRTFTVPEDWKSSRVLLHVGACDWNSWVWINGNPMGFHEGGYSPASFDITSALHKGENTVIIRAFDDVRSGLQPLGKQSSTPESEGIFYTRTTGIWQTVWLEGVGSSYIREIRVTPDPDHSRILLQAEIDGLSDGLTLQATASANTVIAGEGASTADWRNTFITLDLFPKHLWTVNDPFLYNLKLTLKKGNEVIDEVNSYFGLRKVTIEGGAILLNGQPIFLRAVLDQGFYPEGVWTAPTDAALRGDIELSQSVGFNSARLHQKVFEPRFLYWADRLGYLVWGEYPSYGPDYGNAGVNRPWIEDWVQIVRRDRNHPSVIGWCPFNETPGEAGDLQITVYNLTRAIDPTRPVIDTSGWTHSLPHPEIMDAHDYNQDPQSFRDNWENYFKTLPLPARYGNSPRKDIPFYISEFGGIGWFKREEGKSWGYGNQPKTLDEFYERFAGLTGALLDNNRMFGYCYTQLTDIEQERNGIFYYDRTPKFDAAKLHAIQSRPAAYETNPPLHPASQDATWRLLLGGAPDGNCTWKYTIDPPIDSWNQPNFDDSQWKEGQGGFGSKEGWEKYTATPWRSKDIWMRRGFDYDGGEFQKALLVIHYDNATEVFVNGQPVWNQSRWNDQYMGYEITETLKPILQKGNNTIAIHCHQDEGGQFIDAAILLVP